MAFFRSLGRGVLEALGGVVANSVMSLASISTVALTMLILAGFLLAAVNLDHLATVVESQIQLRVYLADGLAEEDFRQLEARIAGLPGVVSHAYVDRKEALERFRGYLADDQGLLEAVEELDALPDSFEIHVLRPDLVERVAYELKGQPGIASISYPAETVRRLIDVTNLLRLGGLAVALLLTGVAVFIIANTIRITVFARRDEITIMKLVGAADWYIRWPFLLEGTLLGMVGAGLAALAAGAGYRWLIALFFQRLPFLPLVAPEPLLGKLSLVLLVLGALVGVVGSQISVRRLLRV
ncbi:MAG: permease-like cell division protein FtsX [bacterium]|nr:permease-like cell division protein FtsX [bacterium]